MSGTRGSTNEDLSPLSFRNLPSSQEGKDRSSPLTRLSENNAVLYISIDGKEPDEGCRSISSNVLDLYRRRDILPEPCGVFDIF